jgi:hypothetical protein
LSIVQAFLNSGKTKPDQGNAAALIATQAAMTANSNMHIEHRYSLKQLADIKKALS